MSLCYFVSPLLRTIYFTHGDFGDQVDDECLKILNKNQTAQMSQQLSELEKVAYKRNRLFSFCTKKETDVKNSTL